LISVIICSINPARAEAVSRNVALTIGVRHEIIVIDNRESKYGIGEAYNIGAARSRYDVLCFMHEDILFHTACWGEIVAATLADASIGLIGVAGNTYKTRTESGWWITAAGVNTRRRNIIQHYAPAQTLHEVENPHNEVLSEVVVLDGVWLCMPKRVWQRHAFDAETLKGFHFYDLDISLQVKRTHRVCVVHTILIEHYSAGSVNTDWLNLAVRFADKWKNSLPMSTTPVDRRFSALLEYEASFAYLQLLRKNCKDKRRAVRFLAYNLFHRLLYYREKLISTFGPS
jgi:glycosyltransferase involved in cell wall biosynthesis